MRKAHSFLIIDDHPIIVEGYSNALKFGLNSEKVLIDSAHNCETAIEKLKANGESYDLVILDISLPHYVKMKINSGEELGIWIRKSYPLTKILVATSHNDNLRLNFILKSLNPEGFLIKSDINSLDLVSAATKLLEGGSYYSTTILSLMRKRLTTDLILDEMDVKILQEISNGARMKEMTDLIPMSKTGIERRKKILKRAFDVRNDSDRELIVKAREKGFI